MKTQEYEFDCNIEDKLIGCLTQDFVRTKTTNVEQSYDDLIKICVYYSYSLGRDLISPSDLYFEIAY